MKINKLTLHNIASIEDATIDFSAAPLADSDVFLISGKTGAGKTTILDAICLALYANTPRFANNQIDSNNVDDDIRLKDPRQILRRNTGEGFVMLEFTGNNGVDYESTWAIRRARNKPTGNLQNSSWSLKRLDDNRVLTRVRDIEGEIAEAIGLDFTQFCRTSMLAQGEFAKFLNSKDDAKAAILERITGTSIYSRIGSKIYEICAEKEAAWKDARRQIEGVALLDEEQVDQIKAEIKAMRDDVTEKEKVLKISQLKIEWLKTLAILQKTLTDAEQKMQSARQTAADESLKQKQRLETEWNATTEARGWIESIHDRDKKITDATARLVGLKTDFDRFCAGKLFEQQKIDNISRRLADLGQYFEREEPRRSAIENRTTIEVYLNSLESDLKAIAAEQSNISNGQKKLADLKTKQQEATEFLDKVKGAVDKRVKEIEVAEKALEEIGLGRLRADKDKSSAEISKLNILKVEVQNFVDQENTLSRAEDDLNRQRLQLDEKQKQLEGLKSTVETAKADEEQKRALFESQKDTVHKFAKDLRARLHVGDDCPVCRQRIEHAFVPEDELDAIIANYRVAWEGAAALLKQNTDKANKAEAEVKTATNHINQQAAILTKNKDELSAKRGSLLARVAEFGINELIVKVIEIINNIIAEREKAAAQLSDAITAGEAREKELRGMNAALATEQNKLDTTKDNLQKIKDLIAGSNTAIEVARKAVADRTAEVEQCRAELSNLVVGTWNADWRENIPAFRNELRNVVKQFNDNKALFDTLDKQLAESKTTYNTVLADHKSMIGLIADWDSPVNLKPVEIKNIIVFGNEIIQALSAETSAIAVARKEKDAKNEAVESFLVHHPEFTREQLENLAATPAADIKAIAEEIKRAAETLVKAETTYNEACERLKEHNERRPEFAEDDTLETLEQNSAAIDAERQNSIAGIGALTRDLEENQKNQARVADLKKVADERKAEFDRWAILNRYLGSAKGDNFRKIAQSFVLESLIHSANHYMKTLSGRYLLRSTPGSFVIMVDDAYQGGTKRASSTLSGGETFLVSLSLALALSDIGDRLGVNTLFIDEGFGSLSDEPLQNAIDTLRTLHTRTGRHVGIISHIDELRERIPVQIHVDQAGNSSHSTISVI
ncbi:MAG: AAA family ATPase [Muribaculaceae bacterium]|nr:AAA family ATPase [Muribaculaceae bacterium]